MKGVNMMFLGGLMMAIGVENSGLHRRVALGVLKVRTFSFLAICTCIYKVTNQVGKYSTARIVRTRIVLFIT